MDQSSFFSGSANFRYNTTTIFEQGVGSSRCHSITAMKEYKDLSNEEIRIEDYRASGGLFGSAIAKIGGALCAQPKYKLRPYEYWELYRKAIPCCMCRCHNSVSAAPFNRTGNSSQPKTQNKENKPKSINVTVVDARGAKNIHLNVNKKSSIKEVAESSLQSSSSKQPMHGKENVIQPLSDKNNLSKGNSAQPGNAMNIEEDQKHHNRESKYEERKSERHHK